jgi:flagellar biosynthesis/type III secretory pathway M-ring protein FliF/YscJ
MNKELLEIHGNVKDWLRFAEAKNAMLIAFNGASIYGVAKLSFWVQDGKTTFIEGYLYFMIIILVLSIIVCLVSFVPRVKFMLLSVTNFDKKNNIFFFEHLAKINATKIIKELKEKGVNDEFTDLDTDIAVQVHQLSTVASRKYGLFTVAVWTTVSAYVTPIIAVIAAIYVYKK